jgi:putative ABC transport system substrate-binding protein
MLNKMNTQRKSQKVWALFSWVMIAAMLLSGCGQAQPSKIYKVGILAGLGAFAPAVEGFKSKMAEQGYVEGENITYDLQSTNVDIEAYKSISQKFVADKVDLIFAFPTEAAMEAKAATQGTDIPVVFAMAFTDVPGVNLIDSVREPGGNITGVRFPSAAIASRRLKILSEMAPLAKRVFVPYLKGYPNVPGQLDEIRQLAASEDIQLFEYAAASPQDLQTELDSYMLSGDVARIQAILMIAEPLGITPDFYSVLGKFSYEHKIPIGGALMNEGEDYASIFGVLPNPKTAGEQAAQLANKIFNGTSAGSIPVITSESNFNINYNAAQDLGVIVPESLLRQADEVIR